MHEYMMTNANCQIFRFIFSATWSTIITFNVTTHDLISCTSKFALCVFNPCNFPACYNAHLNGGHQGLVPLTLIKMCNQCNESVALVHQSHHHIICNACLRNELVWFIDKEYWSRHYKDYMGKIANFYMHSQYSFEIVTKGYSSLLSKAEQRTWYTISLTHKGLITKSSTL